MLPSPDAKPEYHNLRCTIMKIDPDQAPFFYAADAATGKKVSFPTSLKPHHSPATVYKNDKPALKTILHVNSLAWKD